MKFKGETWDRFGEIMNGDVGGLERFSREPVNSLENALIAKPYRPIGKPKTPACPARGGFLLPGLDG